ncbi:hypothetical protein [Sorangium sp. So ce1151]|uniref:hypothetical protein n=1 Tax=Sorangium sp. So ce1151 TaxID=3133332 RepID=UPI003F646988
MAGYTTERAQVTLSSTRPSPAREQTDRSLEEAELVHALEAQHQQMSATLRRYEIPTEGMPTWESVRRALTSELLKKVQKLKEPALLLISPTTRKAKIEAIEAHPIDAQLYETDAEDVEDNNLWNNDIDKSENTWRVVIAEGAQDVKADPDVANNPDGYADYVNIAAAWTRKLEAQGLEVMQGADTYLTLVMKSLAEEKPIDTNTFTALNASRLSDPYDQIAYGKWNDGQLCLFTSVTVDIIEIYPKFRLRGMIELHTYQG